MGGRGRRQRVHPHPPAGAPPPDVRDGTAATLSAAGLRLLSLDPFDVAAILHDLRPDVDGVAASTMGLVDAEDLPHASTPCAEIDVEVQSALPTRLFRS